MIELNIPIRFYDTLEEKYRYCPECEGVKLPSDYHHLNYPGDYVPPYQAYKPYNMLDMPDFPTAITLVNVCTGVETELIPLSHDDFCNIYAVEFNGEQRIYLLHYGSDGYGFDLGIYYLRLTWGSVTLYSEDWKSGDFEDTESFYRVVQTLGDIRAVDSTDVRVWRD